jgi:hypothetical protein
VAAQGLFPVNGPAPKKGQQHTFATSAGKLTVVVTAAPARFQNVSLKACHFTYPTYVSFAVLGGKSTGRFARSSGPGSFQVSFAGYGPRYKSGSRKGRCDTSPNAPELASGAVALFLLSAVIKA